MTLEVKQEYLKILRLRYKNATKRQKGTILSEFCETAGLSRKHVIRLLNCHPDEARKKAGPKAKYGEKVVRHLLRLWKAMNKMCSIRMKQALPIWLEYDETPDLDEVTRSLLKEISPSSIDRLLRPFRSPKGMSSTIPSTYIKSRVPIELLDENVKTPGFIEADTVVHCGTTLLGRYASTLTMTDLYSGWTENYIALTKEADVIVDGIKDIRRRFPFRMKGFASDNGTEFLNHKVIKYLENKKDGFVKIVRRRPYKKNDNAHVEQKNDTHVRQLFGYDRIEHGDLVAIMNDIYAHSWNLLLNHFYPVMKLKQKIRIAGKVKKIYDTPATPYQRLLNSGFLTNLQTEKLELRHSQLNPFEMEKKLKEELKLYHKTLNLQKNIVADTVEANAS